MKSLYRAIALISCLLALSGCTRLSEVYRPTAGLDESTLVFLKEGEEPKVYEGKWKDTQTDHQKHLDDGYVLIGYINEDLVIKENLVRDLAKEKGASLARYSTNGDFMHPKGGVPANGGSYYGGGGALAIIIANSLTSAADAYSKREELLPPYDMEIRLYAKRR